jgi:hypothetical protein
MNRRETSLRRLIGKWVAPTSVKPVRITRISGMPSNQGRCVCVQVCQDVRSLTIFFFRHGDGSWYVFPPVTNRPAMRAERWAA